MLESVTAFNDIVSNPVEDYKCKTERYFNGISFMNLQDILESISFYIEEFVKEYNQYSDEKLIVKETLIVGSRSRGKEKEDSDLDVLVLYEGAIREDHLFNVINDNGFSICDVAVDFNPIKVEDAPDWLRSAEEYLEGK